MPVLHGTVLAMMYPQQYDPYYELHVKHYESYLPRCVPGGY